MQLLLVVKLILAFAAVKLRCSCQSFKSSFRLLFLPGCFWLHAAIQNCQLLIVEYGSLHHAT